MPQFLRVITSSVVYSSKSLAMPQKSVSLLLKGPMVMKGASFPVMGSWYGVAWLCRTTISGKRSLRNCTPLGLRRHPLWVVTAYSCSMQSHASNWCTIRRSEVNETGWFCWFLNVIFVGSSSMTKSKE